jgi:adenylate kinase
MTSLSTHVRNRTAIKPLAVVLLGPPGAGKGTHAGPLSAELGLPHISTGDLFREHIRNQTELGRLAKVCIDAGNLVPDELVFDMLFQRIEREDCAKGYILDGFPRTLPQAQALDAYFGDNVRSLALYFSADDSVIVERIVGRVTCKKCARPYHLHFDPPKVPGFCDACKLPLFQREDDREEVVRKRLQVYRRETQPVIDYYAKNLIEINAVGSKEEIFQQVLRACHGNF